MRFDDLRSNAQAQAMTCRVAVSARLVGTVEAVEHMGQVLGGDGGARVGNAEERLVAFLFQGHVDLPVFASVFAGVLEQGVNQAVYFALVALKDDALFNMIGDGDVVFPSQRLELQQRALNDVGKVEL